jgi:SAM-dependent methyltransferase
MAPLYDLFQTGLEGDTAFYAEEARRAGSPVLELGCGTGRTLFPMAQAGVSVVGLDRSPEMLAVARRKLAALDTATQAHVRLVEGDMRDAALGERFRLVTIPYRAFLHLLTVDDQRQTLARVREHLVEGGRLALNVFDPRLDIIATHTGGVGTSPHKAAEFRHPDTGARMLVWDTRQYDPETQLLEQEFIVEELDAAGRVTSKTYSPFRIRYVHRYEMQHLLELCGFAVEALYGDFARGPFRYGGEQVWIGRKA